MDIAKMIRAVGEPTGQADVHKRMICKVRCQGCGGVITSADEFGSVEYVRTKRGSQLFFHRGCVNDVWRHGIV